MQEPKISIIGLGYVGLPMAVAFGKRAEVIAFDINKRRITQLLDGVDITNEVSSEDLSSANLKFTSEPEALRQANFHIIAVPTPIDANKLPNLAPLFGACELLAKYLKSGDVVVFESTVYPGATEEDCVPILEKVSGLLYGKDFSVGYSPERINPGDKEHTFSKIVKVVAGSDEQTLDLVANVYSNVVDAGVYRAQSIKVAEAAKVIENTQRDLNIALMNELAVLFRRMNIDTMDVLNAASTKWNFLPFRPGMVGGHCIGVDPYYLTHKAKELGVDPEIILAGRRTNDGMSKYIASEVLNYLEKKAFDSTVRIGVLGVTFKENCPDIRNSKVFELCKQLRTEGIKLIVNDPLANPCEVANLHDIELEPLTNFVNLHLVLCLVAHDEYVNFSSGDYLKMLENNSGGIFDLKSIVDRKISSNNAVELWRL